MQLEGSASGCRGVLCPPKALYALGMRLGRQLDVNWVELKAKFQTNLLLIPTPLSIFRLTPF